MADSTPHGQTIVRWFRVISWVLLLSASAIVAEITFSAGPPDPEGQLALREFLVRGYQQGLPTWITFGKIEFAANILMFVPIGFFGALCLPRFGWLIIPIAIAASTGIEIVQSARLPHRVGTPRDVAANTLGAIIGVLLAYLLVALVRRVARRRAQARADAAPISGAHRAVSPAAT